MLRRARYRASPVENASGAGCGQFARRAAVVHNGAVHWGDCGAEEGVDWDGDGDQDIVSGNTAGYIEFFENLSGPGVASPKWAAPRRLEAGGKTFRIMAGENRSIQGPVEAKWGYTVLNIADWDGDGLPDIVTGKRFWAHGPTGDAAPNALPREWGRGSDGACSGACTGSLENMGEELPPHSTNVCRVVMG